MKQVVLLVVAALSCACAGIRPAPSAPDSAAPPSEDISLLNPLLRTHPALEFKELKPFSYKIRALIEKSTSTGQAEHVAVYFRDMENGPLRGANFEEKFSPASLLKVPLMMATLKLAEADPAILERRLRNDGDAPARSDFNGHALQSGKDYTVEQLLRAMIVSSDNNAVLLLRQVVGDAPLNDVFQDFGLVIPAVRTLDDSMSVREYASFFRILYNASYLNKEMSQKALEYLLASDFKRGIVAGVPPGVRVAHKFGERSHFDSDKKQLHDCGIVYHPRQHYILCVMSRGQDFDKLSGVIRDISALVYSEVTTGRRY